MNVTIFSTTAWHPSVASLEAGHWPRDVCKCALGLVLLVDLKFPEVIAMQQSVISHFLVV